MPSGEHAAGNTGLGIDQARVGSLRWLSMRSFRTAGLTMRALRARWIWPTRNCSGRTMKLMRAG